MNDSLDIAKGMNGLHLIGSLINDVQQNISIIPFVLAGEMDDELKRGLHLHQYGVSAPYNPNDEHVALMLERMKHMFRRFIQGVFETAAREDERIALQQKAQVLQELKNSSKPSKHGTVSEIAAKLGISKSEVRRRKADGTLDELFSHATVN